jgi:uncharacterized protein (TIGR02271 family)
MTTYARPEFVELVEEQLEFGKRQVERGRVVVRTRAEERDEVAEIELQQEDVSVERVARGVPVEALPAVHEEDGVLIIPVVEEQLVVTTRLILKEEIRISRQRRTEFAREPVRLRSERADIQRLEGRSPVSLSSRKGVPSMTDRTLTAMYDTRGAAETARDELVGVGVAREAISIHGTDGEPDTAAATESPGFWASLADLFMPDEDRHTYTEGLNRGGYLLSARVPEELADTAGEVLESSDPIDLDQRSESWRQEGWAGYQTGELSDAGAPARAAYGEGAGLREVGTPSSSTTVSDDVSRVYQETGSQAATARMDTASQRAGEDVIQVAEEELRIGKREVGRGGVRVRSYVTERPVEEQVELRQERVSVERRPVDRELAPGDAAFQERTIEAVERGEEAVVSKTARVTEEIGVRKDVEHATETVRDTVRKQEVEVEDDRGHRKPTGTGTVVEDSVVDPDLAGTSR